MSIPASYPKIARSVLCKSQRWPLRQYGVSTLPQCTSECWVISCWISKTIVFVNKKNIVWYLCSCVCYMTLQRMLVPVFQDSHGNKGRKSHCYCTTLLVPLCWNPGQQHLPDLLKLVRRLRAKKRVSMLQVSARLGISVSVDKPPILSRTATRPAPTRYAFPLSSTQSSGILFCWRFLFSWYD